MNLRVPKPRIHEPLALLLLCVSGNPALCEQPWSKAAIPLIAILLFALIGRTFSKRTATQYAVFLSVLLGVLVVQQFTLGFLSKPFVIGLMLKVYIGAIIITWLGREFPIALLNALVISSVVSFPFYLAHVAGLENILDKFALTPIEDPTKAFSIGLYTVRPLVEAEESILRNSGIFWEPGAFQGYLNLAFLLNFHNIPHLLRKGKLRLFILLVAFATTFSTTGYIVFFLILISYLLFYVRLPLFVVGASSLVSLALSAVVFLNADFLHEKIAEQLDEAIHLEEGEFSNRRFGSLKFDLFYIGKAPLFGNGYHENTRFRFHPELLTQMEKEYNLGHGNGFSDLLASAGLIGGGWYFLFLLYSQRKNPLHGLLLLIVVITLLQGEQFLNFPLFLALPFLPPNPRKSRWTFQPRRSVPSPFPTPSLFPPTRSCP